MIQSHRSFKIVQTIKSRRLKIKLLIESSSRFVKKCKIESEKDFMKHHQIQSKLTIFDENLDTIVEIVFLISSRKKFKILLDVLISAIDFYIRKMVSI